MEPKLIYDEAEHSVYILNKKPVAISKEHWNRIALLTRKFYSISKIPDSEQVEFNFFVINNKTGNYEISELENLCKINELTAFWQRKL
jgi:hypothetical protein